MNHCGITNGAFIPVTKLYSFQSLLSRLAIMGYKSNRVMWLNAPLKTFNKALEITNLTDNSI